jgi:hypothetical protein
MKRDKINTKLIELQLGASQILKTFSHDEEYVKKIPEWIQHFHDCIQDIAEDLNGKRDG